ncbi:phosphomevalonate kinase [Paramicrobacterium agarici]|uniref:phosphomevalonate kinase n=1 Tax=Paramicrobacterium agarici TaxID=630514 RepID=UPI00114E9990|nr:phosphomevalonate kinase [Microbacterium agarici]TQO21486.1 phosphomevalonate kinase [Microbacterium agarici]
MITVKAPGKLFIAGEYAVVEPGYPSVLVAVDRFVRVELTPSVGKGSIHSEQYGRQPLVWYRDARGIVLDHDMRPVDYILSSIETVEQYVSERAIAPRFYDLSVSSELDDVSGRKFGLGSSAAVTVATINALNQFYDLQLTPRQRYKLAMLATIAVSPHASGGDLAASTFGGWIAYSAPDRIQVLRLREAHGVAGAMDADWDGFSVRRLAPPSDLQLIVGWTGEPASTSRLVDDLRDRRWAEEIRYSDFLEQSRHDVEGLIASLDADDAEGVKRAIKGARRTLSQLDAAAKVGIETPALARLSDTAEAIGAAGKSSGAGGGDCGVVLASRDADLSGLLREWERSDIRHLALAVHPSEGGLDEQ